MIDIDDVRMIVSDTLARQRVLGAVDAAGSAIDCIWMRCEDLPHDQIRRMLDELLADGELEFFTMDLGGIGMPAFRRVILRFA